MRKFAILIIACLTFFSGPVLAAVVAVTGNILLESSPYPGPSDSNIFVFDEQQGVAFVASQSLDYGSIAAGTLVDSHYVIFDPASPSGEISGGSITFEGIILGLATSTVNLDQDLSADSAGTSDSYFGLADTLGPYETGADPSARGLGSPEDDLAIAVGSNTFTINSLGIPSSAPENIDGFRVFTTVTPVPLPAAAWSFGAALLCLGVIKRRKACQ